jgi:quercetin dioxygenase-like cupin family protein
VDIIAFNTQKMSTEQFPKSETLALHSAVEYTENSIVSRQVMKEPGGNVTLFAFDRHQELSEHTAPFDALVQVLEGRAEIYISGRKYLVKVDSSIIMPAGIPHAVKAPEKFKMLLTMLRKSS